MLTWRQDRQRDVSDQLTSSQFLTTIVGLALGSVRHFYELVMNGLSVRMRRSFLKEIDENQSQ